MLNRNKDIKSCWNEFNLDHFSASQLTTSVAFWLFKYGYLTADERRQMKVGYSAIYGSVCHNAAQNLLSYAPGDITNIIEDAQETFLKSDVIEENEAVKSKLVSTIPSCVYNTVKSLSSFCPSENEVKIEHFLKDIAIPVIGYVDLVTVHKNKNMFCEIKTKAHKKTRILKSGEQGFSKPVIPKKPDTNHLIQTAIYFDCLQLEPTLCYVSAEDVEVFTSENCDELKPESMKYYLEEARQRALIRQNLISISSDVNVLTSITDPDWNHNYQWNIETEFYTKAKQLWQQN